MGSFQILEHAIGVHSFESFNGARFRAICQDCGRYRDFDNFFRASDFARVHRTKATNDDLAWMTDRCDAIVRRKGDVARLCNEGSIASFRAPRNRPGAAYWAPRCKRHTALELRKGRGS